MAIALSLVWGGWLHVATLALSLVWARGPRMAALGMFHKMLKHHPCVGRMAAHGHSSQPCVGRMAARGPSSPLCGEDGCTWP